MQRSYVFALAIILVGTPVFGISPAPDAPQAPGIPNTALDAASAPHEDIADPFYAEYAAAPSAPRRLAIASIALDAPIVEVGVNNKGEMDVPSGKTGSVGWYRYGPLPGETGSAVLDAHVYAAFKNLKKVRVGDIVTVTDQDGDARRFEIVESAVYALDDVPAERLFARADAAWLNLITCEGRWSAARQTYTHRRVVYARAID